MKRFHDMGLLDSSWIERYCRNEYESCVRYRMEENGEYHPDTMLPDGTVDASLHYG